MQASLDNNFGKVFPPAIVYGSYLIFALGIYSTLFNFFGLLFVLLGAFGAFARNGMLLNPEKDSYKSYTWFLGLKLGSWQSMEGYSDLSILKSKQSTKAYSRAMIETETSNEEFYDIYLLSKNHRKKLLIKRSSLYDQAKIEAELLAQALNRPLVPYQPQLSAATQARRARRR